MAKSSATSVSAKSAPAVTTAPSNDTSVVVGALPATAMTLGPDDYGNPSSHGIPPPPPAKCKAAKPSKASKPVANPPSEAKPKQVAPPATSHDTSAIEASCRAHHFFLHKTPFLVVTIISDLLFNASGRLSQSWSPSSLPKLFLLRRILLQSNLSKGWLTLNRQMSIFPTLPLIQRRWMFIEKARLPNPLLCARTRRERTSSLLLLAAGPDIMEEFDEAVDEIYGSETAPNDPFNIGPSGKQIPLTVFRHRQKPHESALEPPAVPTPPTPPRSLAECVGETPFGEILIVCDREVIPDHFFSEWDQQLEISMPDRTMVLPQNNGMTSRL
ncbi:hypothetical protein C8J56DRAFT_1169637 [Mycena floridula]|nr:hypothetical protein C8J56DRAFT_1169637 [Mycena floridula]